MRPSQRDLGRSVQAIASSDGGWRVESAGLDLGWVPRRGAAAGTAVQFDDRLWEVVDAGAAPQHRWWSLRPWDDTEPIRSSAILDVGAVAQARVQQVAAERGRALLIGSLLLAPVLGAAPARVQTRWHGEWGFPARAATLLSAVGEALIGGVGTLDALARCFLPEALLPGWMAWLAIVGPILLVEAYCRLHKVIIDSQPMGSLLGLPFGALQSSDAPASRVAGVLPQLVELDLEAGRLELYSPILRRDWSHGGRLEYRGRGYRLADTLSRGHGWVYGFCAEDRAEADGPCGTHAGGPEVRQQPIDHLRLVPALDHRPEASRQAPQRLVRTALLSAAFCLAPARHQTRWARHLAIDPVWLTLGGAITVLIGGLSSVNADLAARSPAALFDLLPIGEGLVRGGSAVVRRRPLGSLLGLPLGRLFDRRVEHLEADTGEPGE